MKWKTIFVLLVSCVATPIVISQVIRLPFGSWTIGDENSWVGFFGGFIGGIIGGLVAVYVAKYQIDRHFKIQIAQEETVRFINQMPTLVKLRYELDKMSQSILGIMADRNFYEKQEGLYWLHRAFEMYEQNEGNWNSIDHIENIDLNVMLVTLKYRYKDIYEIMTYDIVSAEEVWKILEDEYLSDFNFEKLDRVRKIKYKNDKSKLVKMSVVEGDVLDELNNEIINAIDLIKIVLNSIEDEKNKRYEVRDSITP